jgi:hypothetical protein
MITPATVVNLVRMPVPMSYRCAAKIVRWWLMLYSMVHIGRTAGALFIKTAAYGMPDWLWY